MMRAEPPAIICRNPRNSRKDNSGGERSRLNSMFASLIARSERSGEFSHSLDVPGPLFDVDESRKSSAGNPSVLSDNIADAHQRLPSSPETTQAASAMIHKVKIRRDLQAKRRRHS